MVGRRHRRRNWRQRHIDDRALPTASPPQTDHAPLQINCHSDVAGPKVLAYSRVRSVAAARSLRPRFGPRLDWHASKHGFAHNFHDFRRLAKPRLPDPIFDYIDGPRTRRQRTGATRKPSKAATLYQRPARGGERRSFSHRHGPEARIAGLLLPQPCSACSTISVNAPSRPRLRNMARCSACLRSAR